VPLLDEVRRGSDGLGDLCDAEGWLRFYNFERPHRGYRTKGRRPAEIFYAERPALLVMKGWDIDELTPQSVRP
jgi:hypothetical protein